MKPKELMVGDYIIRKNVPKEFLIVNAIDSIRDMVYLDLDGLGITEKLENIEPIPLTAEILEKNGFKECTNGDCTNDNVDFILHRRKDGIFRIQNTNMTLPYVSFFNTP